ncbi:MAG TPA: hypothetical protein V6D17_12260 [Candidatus Obscuribacterales bacterium]
MMMFARKVEKSRHNHASMLFHWAAGTDPVPPDPGPEPDPHPLPPNPDPGPGGTEEPSPPYEQL